MGWDLDQLEKLSLPPFRTRQEDGAFGIDPLLLTVESGQETDKLIGRNAAVMTEQGRSFKIDDPNTIAVFSGPNDDRACPLCIYTLGMQVRVGSLDYSLYSPPIHVLGRHFWEYMSPDAEGAEVTFVAPPIDLVKRHGGFVAGRMGIAKVSEAAAKYNIPATPLGRDFVLLEERGAKLVRYAPDIELSGAAKREFVEASASAGVRTMPLAEGKALLADPKSGLQELVDAGFVRTHENYGATVLTTELPGSSAMAVRQHIVRRGDWEWRIESVKPVGWETLPGGKKQRVYKVEYRKKTEFAVEVTRRGRLEIEGKRLD